MGVRLPAIQGLRGLAALMVVAAHGLVQAFPGQRLPPLGYGCDLFFVVSGFVMAVGEPVHPVAFLKKRALRIVPLYWLATGAAFAGLAVVGEAVSWGELAASLAFAPLGANWLPVLSVGWTLNYEAFFYVLFAVSLLLPAYRVRALSAVLAVMVVLGLAFKLPGPVEFWFNPVILEFAAGMLVARLYQERLTLSPVFAAIAVGISLLLFAGLGWAPRVVQVGLPATLLVYAAVSVPRATPGWLVGVGAVSYSLYLTHPFVLHLLHGAPSWLALVLAFPATLAVATACYFLVERPKRLSPVSAPQLGR